ncbi:MAG: DUF4834 family protein [Bacteroidota bacterium]
MQEASLTGFLVTISYIILIYYGIKIIGRYVFPIFFNKMVKNFEKKVRDQQGHQQPEEKINVGETTIEKTPQKENKANKNVGEYVDYEEVDDE